jgi:hypothetical protein
MNRHLKGHRDGSVTARWRAFYGAHPLHLLAVLSCLALAGYAALRATANPLWPRMLIWFAAAIVAHDLVLFPLYTAADRLLTGLWRRVLSSRIPLSGGAVNYVRVPLLGAALTFLLFLPGIIRQGGPAYHAATGLDQRPYLDRWLLLCIAMFLASALVLAVVRVVQLTRAGTRASGRCLDQTSRRQRPGGSQCARRAPADRP